MINRYLPIAVLAFALAPAAVACGGDEPADDTESGEGAASSAKGFTMTCAFESITSDMVSGSLLSKKYTLDFSGERAVGLLEDDNNPDRWSFSKKEGTASLYTGADTALPATLTRGRWSLVQVLSVSAGVADGKAGKVTIRHFVKKGTTITPIAKAEEKDQIEGMDNVAGPEAMDRAILKETVTAVMTLKCSPAK